MATEGICLIKKLADIVREIDHVEKSGRNDFQKYNYVKAADVAWVVRKALCDRNVYLVTDVIETRNYEIPAREGVMQAVDVKVQFSFFDGDAPKEPPIVFHTYGTGTDKGDKAIYKAMTGALKYGLRHAFIIPDESDPEADTKTDRETNGHRGSREAAQAIAQQKIDAHVNPKDFVDANREAFNAGLTYVPHLFYTWFDESQTARIEGDRGLMEKNRDLLARFWEPAVKAVVVDSEQLENLKYALEQRNVPFKLLKSVGVNLEKKLEESIEHVKSAQAKINAAKKVSSQGAQ